MAVVWAVWSKVSSKQQFVVFSHDLQVKSKVELGRGVYAVVDPLNASQLGWIAFGQDSATTWLIHLIAIILMNYKLSL